MSSSQVSDDNSSVKKESVDETADVTVAVGGPREDSSSLALLDGFFTDPDDGKRERITCAVKTLPVVFGRSHETTDSHFVGLGKKKAISRKHFTIYYRDEEGGTAEWDDSTSKLKYVPAKDFDKANDKIKSKELPSRGFFVIECLGKNRIIVDRERVEQGESMVIQSGSAIRLSSYNLYFLLPTDAKSEEHKIVLSSGGTKTKKKRKSLPTTAGSSPSASSNKKPKGSGPQNQTELDDKSTDELLEMFFNAIDAGEWERRHQIIGTAIVHRAVISAAEDEEIQAKSLEGPGVARGDIMVSTTVGDHVGIPGVVLFLLQNLKLCFAPLLFLLVGLDRGERQI